LEPSRLKSIPLFQTVSDEELAEIAPFAEEVSVEAGTQLVREGDFSYDFMAIEEGQAEVSRGDERIAELGPGDFFGEIGVLEKELRSASVVAKTDMRLIVLTGWDMKRMEKSMPQAVDRVREVLEQRRLEG
jgi:CRP/FNR family transcriptional regulator, cyclic AMP receptor protein